MSASPFIDGIRATLQGRPAAAPHSPRLPDETTAVGTFLPTPVMLEPRAVVLRTFFRTILPPSGTVYFAVTIPARESGEAPRHYACGTIDELANQILKLEDSGAETYFALATYKQPGYRDGNGRWRQRTHENVEAVRTWWLDIDVGEDKAARGVGYATQDDAQRALAEFSTTLGIEPTFVVSSGRGLHVYFAFTQPVTPTEWKPVASALKRACTFAGLRADPSRTEDSTTVLRPINCTHRKDAARPLPVRLLKSGQPVEFGRFAGAVQGFGTSRRGDNANQVVSLLPADVVWTTPLPPSAKALAGLVTNDELSAVRELHPYLRGLSADEQFRLLEDTCAAIPESLWFEYNTWWHIIASVKGLHHLDEEKRVSLLDRHSKRAANWQAGKCLEKFKDANGGSVRYLFDLAEAHGWRPPISGPFTEWTAAEDYFTGRFVYVANQSGYLDIKSRQLITAAALDESQSWLTTKLSTTPRTVLKRSERTLRADSLGYHPGAAATYDEDGRTLANLYVPWVPVVLVPTAEEQEIWDWFINEHLFRHLEDQAMRDYFLNALAFPLQYPGRRVASVPLLIGEQFGTGKSTLLERVPRLVYGPRNVTIATQSEIESGFNDWHANAQIVCFPEIWMGAHSNAKKIANELKDKITNDTLRVYPKGLKGYSQPNRATLLATSNFENAVYLREGDRRWGVHVTDAPKMTPGQAAALYAFLDSARAPGVLQHLLRSRDLSSFNPEGEPPMSVGKARVIAASRSVIEDEIVELFQNREPPFDRDLFTLEWLADCLRDRIPGIENMAPKKLAEYVQTQPVSAVRLNGRPRINANRTIDGRGLTANGKRTVWCTSDTSIWETASDKDIARHLADGSRPLSLVRSADADDEARSVPPPYSMSGPDSSLATAEEDAA